MSGPDGAPDHDRQLVKLMRATTRAASAKYKRVDQIRSEKPDLTDQKTIDLLIVGRY